MRFGAAHAIGLIAIVTGIGCGGGGSLAKPVYTEVTLEVDGNKVGPDLWITRDSRYWDDYNNPCTLDDPADWCTTSFNTNRFDVQPSYTTYRVFVRNFANSDRFIRTTVRRKREDGDYDVYRSTLSLRANETLEAWDLGLTFTTRINGESANHTIEPPTQLTGAANKGTARPENSMTKVIRVP